MIPYRLYTLDANDRYVAAEDFQAETDEMAVAFGRWLSAGRPFEIACFDRFVHKGAGTLGLATH